MSQQALEGTWATHADEFEGKRLRLIVLEEVVSKLHNEAMLAALREVRQIQQGMGLTSEPRYCDTSTRGARRKNVWRQFPQLMPAL